MLRRLGVGRGNDVEVILRDFVNAGQWNTRVVVAIIVDGVRLLDGNVPHLNWAGASIVATTLLNQTLLQVFELLQGFVSSLLECRPGRGSKLLASGLGPLQHEGVRAEVTGLQLRMNWCIVVVIN